MGSRRLEGRGQAARGKEDAGRTKADGALNACMGKEGGEGPGQSEAAFPAFSTFPNGPHATSSEHKQHLVCRAGLPPLPAVPLAPSPTPHPSLLVLLPLLLAALLCSATDPSVCLCARCHCRCCHPRQVRESFEHYHHGRVPLTEEVKLAHDHNSYSVRLRVGVGVRGGRG